ncbi:hypothetical protein [Nocardia blacklockiae]|uniref:hypothetical protein n=1 Tax=Nocardia blacklockiae TaxID=480036 RepID=UPI0018958B56|nr:hypothetical protein [Nocardia blacklockiae]MBF6172529.1 hypothetical protein [Nocardia blacklockiae]
MDVGQSTAKALYEQATSGTFRMDEGAAQRCADVYSRFVEMTIEPQLKLAQRVQRHEGFGGFDSSTELQGGFTSKANEMLQALTGMKQAALKMAAAYLRAGNLVTQADAMHARAINTTTIGVQK